MLNQTEKKELLMMLASTAEVVGDTIKPGVALTMADDLDVYPLVDLANALVQCRRELKGRLTLAAIIERIDDGHMNPNEAWAVAILAADEAATVVWTPEIEQAWNTARPLVEAGDKIAARMTFIEAYGRRLKEAKAARSHAVYHPSLGFDASGRDAALREAVERGRLPAPSVQQYLLPAPAAPALGARLGELVKALGHEGAA